MSAKAKRRSKKRRTVPPPKPRTWETRRSWLLYGSVAAGAVAVAVVLALTVFGGGNGGDKAIAGLPNTSDYHSLLVDPTDSQRLVLGTHNGLYVSEDGGQSWRFDALAGDDAMNLARPSGETIWLAGHEVFKKSVDAGARWIDVHPAGLPGLDIHGFAVDPRNPKTLYAAVAGQGLYVSHDGGASFSLVSTKVGGDVMALAVLRDGAILAGDMQQGLLVSADGGTTWNQALRTRVMGLAANPRDPQRLLATGAGIALSTDGGRTWRPVFDLTQGVGPVAWSPSNPEIAYAVGFDRVLYRSENSGQSWQPVGGS